MRVGRNWVVIIGGGAMVPQIGGVWGQATKSASCMNLARSAVHPALVVLVPASPTLLLLSRKFPVLDCWASASVLVSRFNSCRRSLTLVMDIVGLPVLTDPDKFLKMALFRWCIFKALNSQMLKNGWHLGFDKKKQEGGALAHFSKVSRAYQRGRQPFRPPPSCTCFLMLGDTNILLLLPNSWRSYASGCIFRTIKIQTTF